jgi:type IV pilus assembly protein PilB
MPKDLLTVLRNSGLISHSVLEQVETESRAKDQSVVLSLAGKPGVPWDEVGLRVARFYALPFGHLQPGQIAWDVVGFLTHGRLLQIKALPFEQKGPLTKVAAADPSLLGEIEQLLGGLGMRMDVTVAPMREIERELERLAGPQPRASASQLTESGLKLAKYIADGDAARALDEMVGACVGLGGSDVHLSHESEHLVVRLRKDGVLLSMRPACSDTMASKILTRLKVLANLDISEKRLPQDGRSKLALETCMPPLSVLVRIGTIPTRSGEKVAIRILETGSGTYSLRQMGLTKANFARVFAATHHPNGLFLVTGPTGSGKTTMLYAVMKELANDGISVSTIEDPIEYELPGAYQTQVNENIGLSFPVALRALLRQDPNIILLGEMRDAETAQTAMEAALTGRLVLSTLHANSACTAITRLLELGVEPFVLGTCTRAIISQRLVRLLCSCKRPVYRMPDKLVTIKEQLGIRGSCLCEPTGCGRCSFTGFNGRIAIHEVLTLDRQLSDLVLAKATSSQIFKAAVERGFQLMSHDGYTKVLAGLTTVSEIERNAGPSLALESY